MTTETTPSSSDASGLPARLPLHPEGMALVNKLAIWVAFLFLIYLGRNFFFTAFMTFLFSYVTLTLVGQAMHRLSPGRHSPAMRKLLTIGFFILAPVTIFGVGCLVAPTLLDQVQRLAGSMSHFDPETEVSQLLGSVVGPAEFRQAYGGPDDPRYQQGLEEFSKTGLRYVAAYQDFPKLESWLEGGFSRQFLNEQKNQIRLGLLREGTSSEEFATWFLQKKVPELKALARKQDKELEQGGNPLAPLLRVATGKPEAMLEQARRDPSIMNQLRQDWLDEVSEERARATVGTQAYLEKFRAYYDARRLKSPSAVPYTFDEYLELKRSRPRGQTAFGEVMDRIRPAAWGDKDVQLRRDFEATKERELYEEWWRTSSVARLIRRRLQGDMGVDGQGQLDRMFAWLVNLPIELGTALLLSLFICMDYPSLKTGVQGLRETWLKYVYDELAPALTRFAHLVGRAMYAQGLIAVCNAVMMFFVLSVLGVDHEVLLSALTFVLCLVPTLGSVLAWVLIAACALFQPGGGIVLALKASLGVLLVMMLEVFVFSPRILGRAMELHPVVIMAILPIAQYFFGVWGLILATPVAVYVIYVIIFGKELPGGPEAPPPEVVLAPAPSSK